MSANRSMMKLRTAVKQFRLVEKDTWQDLLYDADLVTKVEVELLFTRGSLIFWFVEEQICEETSHRV